MTKVKDHTFRIQSIVAITHLQTRARSLCRHFAASSVEDVAHVVVLMKALLAAYLGSHTGPPFLGGRAACGQTIAGAESACYPQASA